MLIAAADPSARAPTAAAARARARRCGMAAEAVAVVVDGVPPLAEADRLRPRGYLDLDF